MEMIKYCVMQMLKVIGRYMEPTNKIEGMSKVRGEIKTKKIGILEAKLRDAQGKRMTCVLLRQQRQKFDCCRFKENGVGQWVKIN